MNADELTPRTHAANRLLLNMGLGKSVRSLYAKERRARLIRALLDIEYEAAALPSIPLAEGRLRDLATRLLFVRWGAVIYQVHLAGPDGIVTEPTRDEWHAALAAEDIQPSPVDGERRVTG